MECIETLIPGVYELKPKVHRDLRGTFCKTFISSVFSKLGLTTDFKEDYYTLSHKNVIRGLHLQTPPHHHSKIVFCSMGEIFDVAVDVRIGSPTYGKHLSIVISESYGNILYLPPGIAHGFCALSQSAIVNYKVSTEYAPQNDTGILWSSVDIDWPTSSPIISDRDKSFSPLKNFNSNIKF